MKGKVKKRMMSSLMVAGMITALFAGCSKEGLEDTHVFNEDTSSLIVSFVCRSGNSGNHSIGCSRSH